SGSAMCPGRDRSTEGELKGWSRVSSTTSGCGATSSSVCSRTKARKFGSGVWAWYQSPPPLYFTAAMRTACASCATVACAQTAMATMATTRGHTETRREVSLRCLYPTGLLNARLLIGCGFETRMWVRNSDVGSKLEMLGIQTGDAPLLRRQSTRSCRGWGTLYRDLSRNPYQMDTRSSISHGDWRVQDSG